MLWGAGRGGRGCGQGLWSGVVEVEVGVEVAFFAEVVVVARCECDEYAAGFCGESEEEFGGCVALFACVEAEVVEEEACAGEVDGDGDFACGSGGCSFDGFALEFVGV